MLYKTLKSSLKEISADLNKQKGTVASNKTSFENISKIDPELEDIQFGKQMSVFIVKCEKKVEDGLKALEEAQNAYTETCDYFMISKQDEMREKTDKFFIFWTQLIDKIDKEIPKPKAAPKGDKLKTAAKKAGNAALMAELASKIKK